MPHIVWRKVDATDLPANHEISESGAVLHLYNVQYEDVGGYECEAINTKGKDWHKAWLYVECKWKEADFTPSVITLVITTPSIQLYPYWLFL